ncbi:hypothetical protein H0H93_009238 [Arthromyces matolae]|nr:hypothetical protein H0H93_009238 [Arthromyces matolae]
MGKNTRIKYLLNTRGSSSSPTATGRTTFPNNNGFETLPPELILEIVECSKLAHKGEDSQCACCTHGLPSWMMFLYLCSSIRTSILTRPHFWREIDLNEGRTLPDDTREFWIEKKLELSKPLTITVKGSCQYEHHSVDSSVLRLVLANLSRIKAIDITELPDDMEFRLLDRVAPELETCRLTLSRCSYPFRRPLNLFAGDSPKLQSLSINGFEFNWQPLLSSKLHTLHIYSGPKISAKNAIALLASMPNLEVLGLEYCLDTSELEDGSPILTQTASLSKLRELTIKSDLGPCVQLLEHLMFPSHPLSQFNISCICPLTNEQGEVLNRGLLSRLAGIIKTEVSRQPLREIAVSCPTYRSAPLAFHGWDTLMDLNRIPTIRILLEQCRSIVTEKDFRSEVFQALLSTATLEVLDLSQYNSEYTGEFSDSDWRRLGEIPSLTHVRLHYYSLREFMRAYTMEGDQSSAVPFKDLHVLTSCTSPDRQDSRYFARGLLLTHLFQGLQARKTLKWNLPSQLVIRDHHTKNFWPEVIDYESLKTLYKSNKFSAGLDNLPWNDFEHYNM